MAELTFADLAVGQRFALGPYRVTREELIGFAREFDPQPFHLDEDIANSSVLGGLATSGWHTSSILMRMVHDAWFSRVNALGSAGIDEMKWLKPVYADDVLSGELALMDVRRSTSRPDRGVVVFEATLTNQKALTVAFMRSMEFVGVR